MPRLRDTRTGVVVSVDDATASGLGAAYEPVDDAADEQKPAATKKAPAKRAASRKKSE